jgi:uncharacterized protein YxeA
MYEIKENDDGYVLLNCNSSVKLGRLIAKVATVVGIDPMDKYEAIDIEKIVDQYKAWYKSSNSLSFKIVKGEQIYTGYDRDVQIRNNGMLGSSCMNGKFRYLQLYTDNEEKVQLLTLVDGDNRIYGRSLIWKLDNRPFLFMDRVYGVDNYVVNTFNNYARENKMAYRSQEQEYNFRIFNTMGDNESTKVEHAEKYPLKTKLYSGHLQFLPYMDSLYIWNKWSDVFSTVAERTMKYTTLKITDGEPGRERIKVLGINIK